MSESNVIDTYGPAEFFSEMIDEFGQTHSALLIGWMVLFGATGGDTRADMIARLVGVGFTKTRVYDAANDIQRLTLRLYKKRGCESELPDFAVAAARVAKAAAAVDFRNGPRPALTF
jgi:hypothetical protein